MFRPVKSKKIYAEIVAQIRELIEKGVLKPGEKLPSEAELTQLFNASRASVREALAALEIIGIIESKRGDGNYIKGTVEDGIFISILQELFSHLGPFELLEARRIIECGVVSLAVQKASPKDIARLQKLVDRTPELMKDGKSWNRINTQFHLHLAKIADNTLLFENMRYMVNNMEEFIFWKHLEDKSLEIPGLIQRFYDDHKRLIVAIKNKESDQAVSIMREHLDVTEEVFLSDDLI
ncbi:MAG: FadR family transcriptional regulator [Firmicutes bacterium]|nr:FadR family transcriptional regulator [Bacillota bacterium]